MRFAKIFIVGPYNEDRYKAIQNFIEGVIKGHKDSKDLNIEIVTPIENPSSDRFNDWILAQIDTCDLLIADMTKFNPNVVYEVAFAHALGTPCGYIRFGEDNSDNPIIDDISHYFKFTLLPATTDVDLEAGEYKHLAKIIKNFVGGIGLSGETILSDYYGMPPIDAEFVRGLAEGYYRNFLGPLLLEGPPKDKPDLELRIAIPDIFMVTDAHIRKEQDDKFGKEMVELGAKKLGRPLKVRLAKRDGETLFAADVPTTILTITKSSKYQKLQDSDKYFNNKDIDRLTNRMALKFSVALWDIIRKNLEHIRWPLDQVEIVWLSQLVGPWHGNEALMDLEPIPRPERIRTRAVLQRRKSMSNM